MNPGTEHLSNEAESLNIIRKMMSDTQRSFENNGFYLMVWGVIIPVCALLQYYLISIEVEGHWRSWSICALGGLVSAVHGYRTGKKVAAKSFIDSYLESVWIAYGVTLAILIFNMRTIGYHSSYSLMIALFGVGAFITGRILKLKFQIAAAIVAWLLCWVSLYVSFENMLILMALAAVITLLIPGILLKQRENE